MATLQSYAPKDVRISFNGIPITGVAPDTFITLRRSEPVLMKTVGAHGELSLTFNADRTGEIDIELMQTSPSNRTLNVAMQLQENLRQPTIGVLMIQDPSGSILAIAKNAFIMEYPEVELAKDQTSRKWMFGCEELEYLAEPPGFTENLPI